MGRKTHLQAVRRRRKRRKERVKARIRARKAEGKRAKPDGPRPKAKAS